MKKKIIKISAGLVALAALTVGGIFGVKTLTKKENSVETVNVLDVAWYNETDHEFIINTVDELYELAQLSDFYNFKGQTIKLGADLVVNEGNAEDWAKEAPARSWSPIVGFAGTFDGQGHTISGLYGTGFERRMALFADAEMSCSVKNLSLVNSYFETSGHVGTASFVSGGGGKFSKLYSDVIINHKGENAGGIASSLTVQSTFEECWFDGDITITSRDCGGIVDEVLGARVTLKHCLFSGHIYSNYDIGGTRTGGIIGRADKAATLIVSDCLASGVIDCDKNVYTGSMIGASYASVQWTITDTYTSMSTYGTVIGNSGAKGTFTGSALAMRESELIGTKAYQWTTLNFDAYWAVVEDGTPILRCFAKTVPSLEGIKKVYDTSWYLPGTYEFTIMTREQLYGFYILSATTDFQDCKVKLGADIVVNEGNAEKWAKEEPELPWFPVPKFAGQFDGQGHTISGLYLKSEGNYLGFIGQATAPSVIQNLNIKNSYFEKTGTSVALMGSVAGDTYGIVRNIYSTAIMVSEGNQVGGIVGRLNDNDKTTSTVAIDGEDYSLASNCWFDGTIKMLAWEEENTGACEAGGIVGRVVQGGVIIEHCLNTGTIESEVMGRGLMVGGLIGSVYGAGNLKLNDCFNSGLVKTNYNICVGSVIGRVNNVERVVDIENTFATTESYKVGIAPGGFKGVVNGAVVSIDESMLSGYKGYQYTSLDFKNYWTVVVGPDGTPILSQFATKKPSVNGIAKLADFSWYSSDKKEYVIDSAADLLGFSFLAATNNFEGKTVKLAADIKLDSNAEWLPIGSTSKPFAGTFDGQGHTISNMNMTSDKPYIGMFGVTNPISVVKNFKLVDSSFTYNGPAINEETGKEVVAYIGSICGDLRGDMSNVYSNAKITSTASRAGGLVAVANGAKYKDQPTTCTITNCWFDGEVKLTGETARYAGGIAGIAMQNGIEFINCLNTGSVSNERKDAAQFLGGILGMEQNPSQITIKDCLNAGKITAAYYNGVGSIVGMLYKADSEYTFDGVYATNESCVYSNGTVSTHRKYKTQTVTGAPVALPEDYLVGTGGYKWTVLDFTKYWVARNAKVPALKTFANSDISTAGVDRVDISWYDAKATELHIKDVADFYGFTTIVKGGTTFADQTVYLDADIKLNDVKAGTVDAWIAGTETPENTWLPIGNTTTTFQGTFDGQGHTISGVYLKTEENYAGLFGVTNPVSMLKNFNLKDSYFAYTGPASALNSSGKEEDAKIAFGSICGDLRGDMSNVYSNAYVTSVASRVGGLVGIANGAKHNGQSTTCTITNCWFDGAVALTGKWARYAGGIAGIAMQNGIEITHCLNTGDISNERTDAAQFIGGILGSDQNASDIKITDCLNAGSITAAYYNGVGSIVGMAYKNGSTYTFENAYAVSESCVYTDGSVVTHKVYTKNNPTVVGTPVAMAEEFYLGTEGYRWTNLDFTGYWAARADKVPALQTFAGAGLSLAGVIKPDTSWYNEEAAELHIKDEADFYGFTVLAKEGNTFEGQTVYLDADLQLNQVVNGTIVPENKWIPIGSSATEFKGTFDGQMHTISGVYMITEEAFSGLFGITHPSSMVKNFKLTDSYFAYTGPGLDPNNKDVNANIGSICGDLRGDMQNVYSSAYVTSTGNRVGGLVGIANAAKASGKATTCTIKNCWFGGEVKATGSARYVGGIAGLAMQGEIEILNCLNTADISNERTSAAQFVGGIIGSDQNASNLTIRDCVNTGDVTAASYNGVGSIVGMAYQVGSRYTFENVYAVKGNCTYPNGTETTHKVYTTNNPTVVGNPLVIEADAMKDINAYKNTLLDFYVNADEVGAWVARTNDYPTLKIFADASMIASLEGVVKDGWYSDDIGNYYLNTPSELRGFAAIVNSGKNFSGKNVYLTADIDLNPGWTAPKSGTEAVSGNPETWTPIGNSSNKFSGVFDGQGHEIKGVYISTSTNYIGLFGYVLSKSAKVCDFRLTNSYINYTGTSCFVGGVVGYAENATLEQIYCKAVVVSKGTEFGGIAGRAEGIIKECWFDGEVYANRKDATYIKAGGIVGTSWSQTGPNKEFRTLTISNCLNTGTIKYTVTTTSGSGAGLGGIYGGDRGYTDLTVTGCVNIGMIDSNQPNGTGSIVGNISKNTDISATDSTVTYSVAAISNCYGAKNVITAHPSDKYAGRILGYNNANCSVTQTDNAIKELSAMQGNAVYEYGGLDLDYDVWVARKEAVPVPRCFVGTVVSKDVIVEDKSRVVADTSWLDEYEGTSADPYQLDSAGDLLGLSDEVNAGNSFTGKYIVLTDDIDYNVGWVAAMNETTGALQGNAPKNQWIPIGDGTNKFLGTFDGQGNTIRGIYVDIEGQHAGFFGYLGDGGVGEAKNFQLVNSYIKGVDERVGGLAGVVAGKATNVYVDAYVIGDDKEIGGIAGRMQGGNTKTIDTCWFDGFVGRFSTATNTSYIGGIVGVTAGGTNKIVNCLNTGTVYNAYTTTNANQSNATAGIVGGHTSTGATTIDKCLNLGTITSPNHVFTGSNAAKSHRGMGPIIGYVNKDGSTVNLTNCVWTNVAELDETSSNDKPEGLRYKGTLNVSGNKQYADEAALIAAVKANESAVMVLGFGDAGEFAAMGDKAPILKDFKTWWEKQ